MATAAGGVFFLVASWKFSLADMGLYAFAISAQLLMVGLVGTGPAVAVVRLSVEQFSLSNASRAAGIALMAAGTAMTVSLLVGLTAALGTEWLRTSMFSSTAVALVAFWAGGRSVLECLRSSMFAQQQYRRAAILTIAGAVIGLSALGVVLATGTLSLERILLAHAIGQTASALLAAALLSPLWKAGVVLSMEAYRQLISYAKWPTLSEGTKLVQSHVGPLILVAVAGAEQAGLYGLGRYPAYVFGVVGLSLYQYWLPQAALHGVGRKLRSFVSQQMKLAVLAAVAMLIGAAAITPLVPLLGENLAAGSHLLIPNALDFALIVMLLPIEAAYHGMRRPHLDFFVGLVKLPILLTLALFLSAWLGAVGMIWSQVIAGFTTLIVAYVVLRKYLISDSTIAFSREDE